MRTLFFNLIYWAFVYGLAGYLNHINILTHIAIAVCYGTISTFIYVWFIERL